ncbi:MAG: hypothetical protein KGL39_53355, partial [Patescibacteria group bacterium]|nr:hypothetical protein [Patescibacteria group bacterium]
MARLGQARLGGARHGQYPPRCLSTGNGALARHGRAWRGAVWPGRAWQGMARQGQHSKERTTMFQVKGELPEWKLIVDVLNTKQIGDVLAFEELDKVLGRDFRSSRTPIYKANAAWGGEQHRSLVAVPNIGYRVIDASEHEDLARRHHRKGRRSLKRGMTAARNADRSLLSQEERDRLDAIELNLSRQAAFMRRLDVRVEKVEKRVEKVES